MSWYRRKCFWLLVLTGLLPPLALASKSSVDRHFKVLVVHSGSEEIRFFREASREFEERLVSDYFLHVNFFREYLQELILPAATEHLAESLEKKYFYDRTPDLIVAVGTPALRLCIQFGASHLNGVPVVFILADRHFIAMDRLPPQITGIDFHLDFAGTIALALRLHPDGRQLFVVSGTNRNERGYEIVFKKETNALLSGIHVTYLDNLSLSETLTRLSKLPEHSIVYYTSLLTDARSETYVPSQIGRSITDAANAPVYNPFSTQLGSGIVGGSFFDLRSDARRAAAMAAKILRGESPQKLPIEKGSSQVVVDWRQLKRWRISETNLPSGTVIRFREPSLLVKFRVPIVGAILVIALQSVLIALLMNEIRKRKLSQTALKRLTRQLMHAQESERARLARELHDDVSQQIAALAISTSVFRSRLTEKNPSLNADLDDSKC